MEKELKVNGMMCVNCQKHVHDALAAMAGVSSVPGQRSPFVLQAF